MFRSTAPGELADAAQGSRREGGIGSRPAGTLRAVRNRARDILERAVAAIALPSAKADALIDDLQAAGLPEDGPVLQRS